MHRLCPWLRSLSSLEVSFRSTLGNLLTLKAQCRLSISDCIETVHHVERWIQISSVYSFVDTDGCLRRYGWNRIFNLPKLWSYARCLAPRPSLSRVRRTLFVNQRLASLFEEKAVESYLKRGRNSLHRLLRVRFHRHPSERVATYRRARR